MGKMDTKTFEQELQLLIRSKHPILILSGQDEIALDQAIEGAVKGMNSDRILFHWNIASGWNDLESADGRGSYMEGLRRILKDIEENPKVSAVYVLKDFSPVLELAHQVQNVPIIRMLKSLYRALLGQGKTIILALRKSVVPADLRENVATLDLSLPDYDEIQSLVQHLLPYLGPEQLGGVVRSLQGLTGLRIRKVLARAVASDIVSQAHTDYSALIELICRQKRDYIRQTEVLEVVEADVSLSCVGGLQILKNWVRQRQCSFEIKAQEYGLPPAKGVLLVGIQGTGKSLCAKTIAREWKMPLLRLDVGRLFAGIVGESESRTRQMMEIAEAMAPCVLWLDEIDKAFGNVTQEVSGDSGTTKRVFGTLITWLQEKTKPVFVVATANNVDVLPPELVRKGRFDELFFLHLPTASERQQIWLVHLKRVRPARLRDFDLYQLAQLTENFSGAEIEQCLYDAMNMAYYNEGKEPREFVMQDIVNSIRSTTPLALLARPQIERLKKWAAESGARAASEDKSLTDELAAMAHREWPKHPEL